MSTVLKINSKGKLEEVDTIFDEKIDCPNCKGKCTLKIIYISSACPKGHYSIEHECKDCGETSSETY